MLKATEFVWQTIRVYLPNFDFIYEKLNCDGVVLKIYLDH